MRRVAVLTVIFLSLVAGALARAQKNAAPGKSPVAAPSGAKEQKAEPNKILDVAAQSNQPTTTEIYADEALFDSNKNVGVFTGHVKVVDPRFNLQSEKLTVFISKGQNQGLEKAIAEGDVAVVRDRPDPSGGPPTRSVGRSDKAVYTSATGNVELTGTPRVQEGLNTHVATSAETVMVVNQNGQLTTHGPSRTEIRQQPKETPAEAKPAVRASTSPKP